MGPIEYLNGLRNLTIVTASVYQVQKTEDKGPFTIYHVLLNDETHAVKNQYLENQTTEDEGALEELYMLRKTNDSTSDAIICWLEKEKATESNDATQARSESSFKVSDPRAILRICSSLFETVDVYSRSAEQSRIQEFTLFPFQQRE